MANYKENTTTDSNSTHSIFKRCCTRLQLDVITFAIYSFNSLVLKIQRSRFKSIATQEQPKTIANLMPFVTELYTGLLCAFLSVEQHLGCSYCGCSEPFSFIFSTKTANLSIAGTFHNFWAQSSSLALQFAHNTQHVWQSHKVLWQLITSKLISSERKSKLKY